MTTPDPLQPELERLRSLLKPDRATFVERQAFHEHHVRAFVDQVRSSVRLALEQEGAAEVASMWMDDARRMLSQWIVLPSEVGGAAHPSGSSDAERQLQAELAATLTAQAAEPSEVEVEDHATEMVQLLLSNWFSLLEHALQGQDVGLLALDFDALPPQARPGAVLAGCEAFALPPLAAAKALRAYQHSLAREGVVVTLSPTLHLLRMRNEWQVASSHQLALASLRQQETIREQATAHRWRFEPVMQMLRPWALARPLDLLGARALAAPSLTLADEQRIAMAAVCHVLGTADDFLPTRATAMSPALLHDLAEQVLTDLGAAALDRAGVSAGAERPMRELQAKLLSAQSAIDSMPDTASLYRIVLSTTGIALAAGSTHVESPGVELALHGEAEELLFSCSVDAARQALADPATEILGQQIRAATGVESSGYGYFHTL